MAKTTKKSKSNSRSFPPHVLDRLRVLRDRMSENKLDAMLVTNQLDIHYLTGWAAEDAWLMVTARGTIVLSDSRFEEELAKQYGYLRVNMRSKRSHPEELERFANQFKWKKIGIQAENVTIATRKAMVKSVGASRIKETKDWLITQRAIKDRVEVRTLREAVKIQEGAFRMLRKQIKPGMTERQIAAQLEYNMRSAGGDGPSFDTIVGAGPNSSKPHYLPGNRKLRKNEPLLIDFGCLLGGYHSDMTRVLFFGKPSKKVAEIYEIVREAMLRGIEACSPGVPLREVDAASRSFIKKAGFDKRFRHGLGHGIGLQIHEQPGIGAKSTASLEPGQVVTIEPGIYLPGIGGVRLEDDILITKTGHTNLCTLPTDLESAII